MRGTSYASDPQVRRDPNARTTAFSLGEVARLTVYLNASIGVRLDLSGFQSLPL